MSDAAAGRLPFDAASRTRADTQRAVTGLGKPFPDAGPFERQLEGPGPPCAHHGSAGQFSSSGAFSSASKSSCNRCQTSGCARPR